MPDNFAGGIKDVIVLGAGIVGVSAAVAARSSQKEIIDAASPSGKEKRRSSRLCLPGTANGAPNPRRLRRPESTLVV